MTAGKKATSSKVTAKKAGKKAAKASTPVKQASSSKVTGKKAGKKAAKASAPVKQASSRKKVTAGKKPVSSLKKSPAKPAVKKRIAPYKEKHGEDYMGAEQTEHFRIILCNWKQELMEEADRTLHHMQDEASNFPDPNDRATQEAQFALELRTRDRERKLIGKIDEAMNKLDSGDYGYCEECGIEIGVRRLEARPTATLCIDCKSLAEIKERQYG